MKANITPESGEEKTVSGEEAAIPVSEKELANKQAILVHQIEEGFAGFKSLILKGDKAGYREFMSKVLSLNGKAESYADFYYQKLTGEQKEAFRNALTEEELAYFNGRTWRESIYFALDEELLNFLLDITMNELLFSTFYFTKYPCTVWGNYGLKFPLFFKNEQIRDRYLKLAEECGLKPD